MKVRFILIAFIIFFASTLAYAQNKAPDDIVTRADINNCFKHVLKKEISFNPHYLKVESAHYTVEDAEVQLTINIRERNDYGAPVGMHERQCSLNKMHTNNE